MSAAKKKIVLCLSLSAVLIPASVFADEAAPAALIRQGRQLLDQRLPEQALSLFRRFSVTKGDDPEGYFWQGVALDEMGDYSASIEAFRACLAKSAQKSMDAAEVRVNLGNALLKSHLADEAIGEFRKAIEIDEREWRAHLNLARALIEKKEYKAALIELDYCADLHFNGMQLPYYRAKALIGSGRNAEAAVQVDRLMQQMPDGVQKNRLADEFKDVLTAADPKP